ncbi:MAG: 30S ribosomal protein S16 [Chloroflexi bacterium]|jgi:small subunit ribosomal protein S16|nr:30S ribosomal protein S16 [Chloroflexota bacterium]
MLRIRLSRTGKKKQASYRVVVADIEAKRDGRVVERLGYYNPLTEPIEYRIQEDRALYWLSVGAQPTDAVRRLLEAQGTMGRLQRLRGGENLDSLVAEYLGVPLQTAVIEEEVDEVVIDEMSAAVATSGMAEEE